ncbi:MAG: DUF819 family protein [bacterium]
MGIAFLLLFYLLVPAGINYLSYKSSIAKKIGTVLIAYAIGLIVGNIGLFPEASQTMLELVTNKDIKLTHDLVDQYHIEGTITDDDLQYFRIHKLQDLMTTLAIALGLPMLLYSLNIRNWFKIAGKTFLSLFLGLISVILPIIGGYFLFGGQIEDSWKIAGMMTGVYSGGTPNLASIQKALDVDTLTYILTHTYDLVIGAVFLLFVMSIGQRVLLKFLPPYKFQGVVDESLTIPGEENDESFLEPVRKRYLFPNLIALGVTLLIIAVSAGLGELAGKESQMVVIILSITSFSIIASLVPRIHRIEKTFDYGMYFILIFSVVVASMADLRYFSASHIHIFYWVTFVYAGSLAIHVTLASLFKIDADNVIIVSTALSCSPPFVPVVAGALKNKEIVVSGLTVGIIGYAIGNYLGVIMAELLRNF